MLFEEYLSRLIQYFEDRTLVMSRQSELWSMFCNKASVDAGIGYLILIGPDITRSTEYPNF